MNSAEDPYSDIKVEVLDEPGVREMIGTALALAGCNWEELQQQARVGRFRSEVAREAWFVVSSFAAPSPA